MGVSKDGGVKNILDPTWRRSTFLDLEVGVKFLPHILLSYLLVMVYLKIYVALFPSYNIYTLIKYAYTYAWIPVPFVEGIKLCCGKNLSCISLSYLPAPHTIINEWPLYYFVLLSYTQVCCHAFMCCQTKHDVAEWRQKGCVTPWCLCWMATPSYAHKSKAVSCQHDCYTKCLIITLLQMHY